MAKSELSHDRVKQALDYDAETGLFTWLETRNNNARAGQLCGRRPNGGGYLSICLDGFAVSTHRMAWFWVFGEWPNQEIDHINGDRADNRIANLRLASHGQNMRNRGLQKNNKSGVRGVTPHKNKWKAQAKVDGVVHYLGLFASIEEAAQRRRQFVAAKFGEFLHPHERLA